jgi:uncharacterized protein (DUF1330 family)
MPAYIIARVTVSDPVRYRDYTNITPGVIARHGGRFLVRGGKVVTLEGPNESRRLVVIEFPTLEKAQAFYDSEDYCAAKALRAGAAEGEFIAVAGVAS